MHSASDNSGGPCVGWLLVVLNGMWTDQICQWNFLSGWQLDDPITAKHW